MCTRAFENQYPCFNAVLMLLKHRLNAVLIAQGCIKTFVLTQPQMFLIYVPFCRPPVPDSCFNSSLLEIPQCGVLCNRKGLIR